MSPESIVCSTSLTANFFISPTATTGAVSVTVTTIAGASGAQSFTINTTPARDIVTLATDTAPGAPPGTGTGSNGDLRYAILNARAGDAIVFNCGNPCTITLGGPLPPITQNQTIDGGMFGRVIIDGNALYRAFFVDSGTVTLQNLQIQNTLAQGGAGGSNHSVITSAGGGGVGLGAGLFVNQAGAAAPLRHTRQTNRAELGSKPQAGVRPKRTNPCSTRV
jgi:hypothetical protein